MMSETAIDPFEKVRRAEIMHHCGCKVMYIGRTSYSGAPAYVHLDEAMMKHVADVRACLENRFPKTYSLEDILSEL